MSLQSLSQKYYLLTEAAKLLPSCPHISTLHRWRLRGVRGVKLPTVMVGGRRMVTADELGRFIEAVTCAADGQPQPVRTARRREQAIEAAERELARESIGTKRNGGGE
jgi:hypothetical protein